MYLTRQIPIKKGHSLYQYFKTHCVLSNNLYNTTCFYLRQYASSRKSLEAYQPLFEKQMELYTLVNEVTKDTKFFPAQNSWLTYGQLDYIFKKTNNADYRNLPAQVNQQTMKLVLRDFKSYFENIKNYQKNPQDYQGRPKMPHYKKKGGMATTIFTNQVCEIKENKYLKFPKTKTLVNIGKCGEVGILKEVRIIPTFLGFTLEVVMEQRFPQEVEPIKNEALLKRYKELKECGERTLAIDTGLSNLCAVVNNFGQQPFLIKGTILKSINQNYNKKMSYDRSMAKTLHGLDYTKRMHRFTQKRNHQVKDYLHKTSHYLVNYAIQHKVRLVIVGHNKDQKQHIHLGTKTNQNFVQIPIHILIHQLRYKLNKVGIQLVETEESYTSKASFLDHDALPTWNAKKKEYMFSGKRVKRGLYRTKENLLVNADINGAANILRKVFPKVTRWDRGIVAVPVVVKVV